MTALPAEVLPEVLGDPERLAVTLVDAGVLVGLLVLSVGTHRDKYLSAPDPLGVALGALSVDRPQQGRGVGTRATPHLAALVKGHFPQAQHVVLAVNQRNTGAKRFYDKVGVDVIYERMGAKGPQWVRRFPPHVSALRS